MASSGEDFLHTCSCYQYTPAYKCVLVGKQESSYSIMHVCTLQLISSICAGVKDKNGEQFPTSDTTFGVQGNVHHYTGLAEPAPGDKLGLLQMYMYLGFVHVFRASSGKLHDQPARQRSHGIVARGA